MKKEEIAKIINDIADDYAQTESELYRLKFRLHELISKAIAEHEAAQWKKYPEEKPEVEKIYWVHNGNDGSEYPLLYNDHLFVLHNIVSFREPPKPYQEGGRDE